MNGTSAPCAAAIPAISSSSVDTITRSEQAGLPSHFYRMRYDRLSGKLTDILTRDAFAATARRNDRDRCVDIILVTPRELRFEPRIAGIRSMPREISPRLSHPGRAARLDLLDILLRRPPSGRTGSSTEYRARNRIAGNRNNRPAHPTSALDGRRLKDQRTKCRGTARRPRRHFGKSRETGFRRDLAEDSQGR